MSLKKDLQQIGEGNRLWCKLDPHAFGVPCLASTDLLVGWLGGCTSTVSTRYRMHAPELFEDRLGTPETTAAQDGYCERVGI